jgi:hypothetical protein
MSGSKHIIEHCETLDVEPGPGDKGSDEPQGMKSRPSSGRTTAQGRRCEKPGSGKPPGPSGQRDECKQDVKHTNK